jgi:hypothetical protein
MATLIRGGRNTYLAIDEDGNDDLTPRVPVTSNMTRKLLDIRYQLRSATSSRSTADAFAESDRLAGDFTVKWSKDQLGGSGAVEDVEACPVHAVAWGGERVVGVPEERGCVCCVAEK